MLISIIKTLKITIEYYTLALIVCKCVSEENCGDVAYKVGYMTKNGVEYFSDNIYPHIEDAVKHGKEYAKNTLGYIYKNIYKQYYHQNYGTLYDKEYFPTRSVVVDGEEFVLTP